MTPPPGIYPSTNFAAYLGWDLPSQTTIKEIERSPAHYVAAIEGDRKKTPTDAMTLGSGLHVAFLEPLELHARVVEWTGRQRRGKEWDEFTAEHEGKYILTPGLYAAMEQMVESLRRHPFVRDWADKVTSVETSVVGEFHGLGMKGRCDALTPDPLVDIKKVRSGSVRMFRNAVVDFGYDVQAAVYRELFNRDRMVLLTVEDQPPYDVVPYELSPAFLRRGERKATEYVEKILECQERGEWPGRSDVAVMLDPPDWAVDSDVTFGGEPLMVDDDHPF